MALTKQPPFDFLHVNQSDTPQPGTATPSNWKQMLDSQSQDMRLHFNQLIDDLSSTTSGASNIGTPALTTGGSTNVQGQLSQLKDLADTKEDSSNITANRRLSPTGDFTGTIQGLTASTVVGFQAQIDGKESSATLTTSRKLSPVGDFTGTISGTASTVIASASAEVISARGGFVSLNARLNSVDTALSGKEDSSSITTNRKLSATGDFTGTLNGQPISSFVPVGSIWGGITGTLSSQTDLQSALDTKANIATTLAGYGITDTQTTATADGKYATITNLSLKAPLVSPALTGTPTAPTPATADSSTTLATTAFVKAQAYAPLASPALTGTPTAPTPLTADNSTTIATTAWVKAQGYGGAGSAAWGSITGTLSAQTDLQSALNLKANLASPVLTGTPTAPTPATADNSTTVATTAFVKAQAYATLASPTFTGTPLSTTAAVNTNTTQIATTAFVLAQAGSATPLINGTATVGTATKFAREDHIHPTDTTRAPLASPSFTGSATFNSAASTVIATVKNNNGSYLMIGASSNNSFQSCDTAGTASKDFAIEGYSGGNLTNLYLRATTVSGVNTINCAWLNATSNVQENGVNLSAKYTQLATALVSIPAISGTATAAKNLRGVNATYTASAATTTVTFATAETDANYAIFIEPKWVTAHAVTSKTTSGFTVTWGTTSGSAQTFDWLLIR